MKKCYKAPELDVVFVDSEEIMADSPTNPGWDDEDTPTTSAASYRSSLWND